MIEYVIFFGVVPVLIFAAGALVGAHNASHVAKAVADVQTRVASLEAAAKKV